MICAVPFSGEPPSRAYPLSYHLKNLKQKDLPKVAYTASAAASFRDRLDPGTDLGDRTRISAVLLGELEGAKA